MTLDLSKKKRIENLQMEINTDIIKEHHKSLTTQAGPPPEYLKSNYKPETSTNSSIDTISNINKFTESIEKNIFIKKLSDEEKKNISLNILEKIISGPHTRLNPDELKLLIHPILKEVAFLKIDKPNPKSIKNKKIIYPIYNFFKKKKVNHLIKKYFKQIKIEDMVSDLKISYTDIKPPAYKKTEMPPLYTRTEQNPFLFIEKFSKGKIYTRV